MILAVDGIEGELTWKIRKPSGATARAAFQQLKLRPDDKRAMRRLIMALTNPNTTEMAEIEAASTR